MFSLPFSVYFFSQSVETHELLTSQSQFLQIGSGEVKYGLLELRFRNWCDSPKLPQHEADMLQ